MSKPLFSYTANFFLTLNLSRPNFKAQALFAADAVAADPALPAPIQAKAAAVRTTLPPNARLKSARWNRAPRRLQASNATP